MVSDIKSFGGYSPTYEGCRLAGKNDHHLHVEVTTNIFFCISVKLKKRSFISFEINSSCI